MNIVVFFLKVFDIFVFFFLVNIFFFNMICKYIRYQFYMIVFLLVILYDFLDYVDGIVVKVYWQMFGQVDDLLLGGFMDVFCDKVFNIDIILYVFNFLKIKVLFYFVL